MESVLPAICAVGRSLCSVPRALLEPVCERTRMILTKQRDSGRELLANAYVGITRLPSRFCTYRLHVYTMVDLTEVLYSGHVGIPVAMSGERVDFDLSSIWKSHGRCAKNKQ